MEGKLRSSGKSNLLLIILFWSFLSWVPTSGTSLNPYSGTGDWILTQGEIISDQTITIDGDIYIESTQAISFSNVVLNVKGTIFVNQGGHIFLNCTIQNEAGATIEVYSHNNQFINNTISGTLNDQILLLDIQNTLFEGNNITHRGLASNGIRIQSSHGIDLRNNNITVVGGSGIVVTDSSGIQIIDNFIRGGDFVSSRGIDIQNSQIVNIWSNVIRSGAGENLLLSGVDTTMISDNHFVEDNYTKNLVYLTNSSVVTSGNTYGSPLSDFPTTGLYVLGGRLSDNAASNSEFFTRFGLRIQNSEAQYIHHNSFFGSELGLLVENMSPMSSQHIGEYHDNTFNSTEIAMEFRDAINGSISSNLVLNSTVGLKLDKASNFLMTDNVYEGGKLGITSRDSSFNGFSGERFVNMQQSMMFSKSHRNNISQLLVNNSELSSDVDQFALKFIDADHNRLETVDIIGGDTGIILEAISTNNYLFDVTINTTIRGLIIAGSGEMILNRSRLFRAKILLEVTGTLDWLTGSLVHTTELETDGIGVFMDSSYEKLRIVNASMTTGDDTIYLTNSNDLDIMDSVLHSIDGNAIFLLNSLPIQIEHNSIISDNSCAIEIHGTSSGSTRSNKFIDNVIQGTCGVNITSKQNQYFGYNTIIGVSDSSVILKTIDTSTEFVNNTLNGLVEGLIPFAILEMVSYEIGDLITITSLHLNYPDEMLQLHYRFDNHPEEVVNGNQIRIDRPNIATITIWTVIAGGRSNENIYKRIYSIAIGPEFVAPLFSSENASSYTIESGTTFLLEVVAEDAWPGNLKYFLNDVLQDTVSWRSGVSQDFSFRFTGEAIYHIRFEVTDSSGNSACLNFTITVVDTIAPRITGKTSYTFERGDTSQIISFSFSDVNLHSYDVWLDSTIVVSEVEATGDHVFHLDHYTLVEGTYSVRVVVRDRSGNQAELKITVLMIGKTTVTPTGQTATSSSNGAASYNSQNLFVGMIVLFTVNFYYRKRRLTQH